jgi:CrcB protein
MIEKVFIVGLGSFFGGGLRFFISQMIKKYIDKPFPLATFVVNLLGCLLIGMFYAMFEEQNPMNNNKLMFLTVGFCGGFTTFSTFIDESLNILRLTNMYKMSLYLIASIIGGMLMIYVGRLIIKSIL